MTPSSPQSRKPLTLEEIEKVIEVWGPRNQKFQMDKLHDVWVNLNDILETARAALKVVKETMINRQVGHYCHVEWTTTCEGCKSDEKLKKALAPFREGEK